MLISIQYLRAIAAICVLFSHLAWKNMHYDGTMLLWWEQAGNFGVDLFFVISGFIMSYTTKNIYQKKASIATFLKKRIIRIIPLYWLLSLVALVVFLTFPDRVNSTGGETLILKSFFLLPVDRDEHYLVDVGWSLRSEFIFYTIFAFTLIYRRVIGRILSIVLLIFLFVFSIGFDYENSHYIFINIFSDLFLEFSFGIILYEVYNKIKTVHFSLAFLALGLGFLQFYNIFSGGFTLGIRGLDSGLAASLIFFGFLMLEPYLIKKPIIFFQELGNASYSLYLLHPFVLSAGIILREKFGNTLLDTELCFTIAMVLLSIWSSLLCYVYIERPMTKYL